jgi:hypothetical protein
MNYKAEYIAQGREWARHAAFWLEQYEFSKEHMPSWSKGDMEQARLCIERGERSLEWAESEARREQAT